MSDPLHAGSTTDDSAAGGSPHRGAAPGADVSGAGGHGGGADPYAPPPRTHRVLLYSDDPAVRGTVRTAVGRRPAQDLGRIEWVEVGDGPSVVKTVDKGGLDLAVLDGEAWPSGGLGLCKQLKDEVRDCPPVVVLIARRDDAWLATWSLTDAVVPLPLDPAEMTATAVEQLRRRAADAPVRRAVH